MPNVFTNHSAELGPCVEWHMAKGKSGHGQILHEGKVRKAHRVAYAKHHGLSMADIDGVVIRHKCDNPSCVNPEHLEPGTQLDNIKDMIQRGRMVNPSGDRNGRALLTADQVAEIKRRHVPHSKRTANSRGALAKEFGVSISTIRDILSGRNWKGA